MKRATRVGLVVALTVFLVAAGTGVSYALWATTAATTADVKTARVELTIDGSAVAPLSAAYRPGEPVTAPVTVTNGGSVLLSYTVGAAATAEGTLTSDITIDIWEVATGADCTAASVISGPVWSGTLAGLSITPTGSLDAAESQVLCVRTALAASATAAQQGQVAAATLTFTGSNGWQSAASVAFNPSVFVVPNTALLASGGCVGDSSDKKITLAWQDVPGTSGYRLYFTPDVSTSVPAPVPPADPYMSVTSTSATISGENFNTVKGSSDGSGSVSIHSIVNGWESAGLIVPVYFAANSTGSNAKISCTAFPVK
ncbi:MAG: hypothetical protein WED09_07915 [Homoserinimonas sp.]